MKRTLTAKSDGKLITIEALPHCADYPTQITGIYTHRSRHSTFEIFANGRRCVFEADEWQLVK
jgi:hypothetical protein